MLTAEEKESMRILIVDDEPGNIQLLANVLSREGYQIEFATNGEEALEWTNSEQFDLILLDIRMPGIDGVEACTILKKRENPYEAPIIFLTAEGDTNTVIRGFEAGAVDYVVKPFNERELMVRVQTHLEHSLDRIKLQRAYQKLGETHDQLEEQHIQLKETQAQLIQSEKMSGLGTLVAGVAHEINNPTNFVYSGAENMNTRLKQLEEFIYKLAGEDVPDSIRDALNEKFQPLFENQSAIFEGASRIKTIVQDLRTFSRLEEAEQKEASIIEGLRSTIDLVRSNYKEQVDFICDFQADPILECWPGQMNQVFMNLSVNACQAIISKQESTNGHTTGELKITTFVAGGELGIRFQDNGIGMSEDVRNRIFDPFFTTKQVGEGTGLGLSISFGIIEKHNGRIDVDSSHGEGTTFTIYLPL